jgi:hypothetical protein
MKMNKESVFMEKGIRRGLIFLGCMMFFVTLEAQKIIYDYDDSGNRVKRRISITVGASRSLAIDTSYSEPNDSISGNLQEPYNWDNEKKDAFEVLVYPNPTEGLLEIELPELQTNQKARLYLYSRTGHLVKQTDKLQKRQSIDISNQPVGIYIMRITVDDKEVTRTIIKGEY